MSSSESERRWCCCRTGERGSGLGETTKPATAMAGRGPCRFLGYGLRRASVPTWRCCLFPAVGVCGLRSTHFRPRFVWSGWWRFVRLVLGGVCVCRYGVPHFGVGACDTCDRSRLHSSSAVGGWLGEAAGGLGLPASRPQGSLPAKRYGGPLLGNTWSHCMFPPIQR